MRRQLSITAGIALGFLIAAVLLIRTRSTVGEILGLVLLVFGLTAVPILWGIGRQAPDESLDDASRLHRRSERER